MCIAQKGRCKLSDPNIRYSRISDILEIINTMAKEPLGVTINDVVTNYNVSRRTAQRMIACILNVLPQINEIETTDTCKHWGFIKYSQSIL